MRSFLTNQFSDIPAVSFFKLALLSNVGVAVSNFFFHNWLAICTFIVTALIPTVLGIRKARQEYEQQKLVNEIEIEEKRLRLQKLKKDLEQ